MRFSQDRARFEREFDEWYARGARDVRALTDELDARAAERPDASGYEQKTWIYEMAARRAQPHVFRHFPFGYELDLGRARNEWGFSGLGGWLKGIHHAQVRAFTDWSGPYQGIGLLSTGHFVDIDHQCAGFHNLLAWGLDGARQRALDRLRDDMLDEQARGFLRACVAACDSLAALSRRVSDTARSMLEGERDAGVRASLERLAESAARSPMQPPRGFFDALQAMIFYREAMGSLEGMGFSTYAQIDWLLAPYYEADVASGAITREEAYDLLCYFLAYTDAKFDLRTAWAETSTTVMIGGCDRDGAPVYNELTRMVIDIYDEHKLVNPKLNARISSAHPDAYFHRLARLAEHGANVLALFNDETRIAAYVREGRAPRDARIYAAGGCQEPLLAGCEVNSRASIYIGLPRVLLGTIQPQGMRFWEREALDAGDGQYDDFESFYAAYLRNLRAVCGRVADRCRALEAHWSEYNPAPMHSMFIDDCIASARDITAGGARYNMTCFAPTGFGTLTDSLYAVKRMVFDERRVALSRLADALDADFEGEQALRAQLAALPKFGQDDAQCDAFAARVARDVAEATSGFPNARGGKYEASLFAYYLFQPMGAQTGATPDGRHAAQPLSRGMGPSDIALARSGVAQALRSLGAIDCARFAGSGVLDLMLPVGRVDARAIEQVMRAFIAYGGDILQLNVLSAAQLREAMREPERHRNLVVRVCGLSVYFVELGETEKRELMSRVAIE